MARPFRSTSLLCATVSVSLLLGGSAEAQRKKKPAAAAPAPAKKKPAAAPGKPAAGAPDQPPDQAATDEGADAAQPKTKTADEEDPKKKPEEDLPKTEGRRPLPMFDAAIGLRGFGRSLSYNDDVSGMPTYGLKMAPAIAAAVEFYPGASYVGITGAFDYGFALGSTYDAKPPPGEEGKTFATKAYGYSIGVKGRLPMGTSEAGLGLEYGGQSFLVNLAPPVASAPGVPDVSYTFIRPNLTGRFAVADKFALRLGLGYLIVISAGEIRSPDYFYPEATKVAAVDVRLGGALALSPDLEGRLDLDFRRYFYAMKPVKGDPFIVGGALDQYYGLTVSIAYRH